MLTPCYSIAEFFVLLIFTYGENIVLCDPHNLTDVTLRDHFIHTAERPDELTPYVCGIIYDSLRFEFAYIVRLLHRDDQVSVRRYSLCLLEYSQMAVVKVVIYSNSQNPWLRLHW